VIGVIAHPSEEAVVREFFELFKTPWEFYDGNRSYEVLLCTQDCRLDVNARVVLFYAGRRAAHFDTENGIQIANLRNQACVLLYESNRIPIYGDTVTFSGANGDLLRDETSAHCAGHISSRGEMVVARIGYDLFAEIRALLTVGQPFHNANIPTVELHIAFLRDLIIKCGVPLVEIPPVPEGHRFIVCLTHDVDQPSIRGHKWDHTIFGFLYRAVLSSARNFIGGRFTFRDLLKNWAAASKLPLVYLGLAQDFWRNFDDRYLELEKNLTSTFFIIPFKDYSGQRVDQRASKLRASRYEAREIAGSVQKLIAAGREIGLHGVDAWLDGPKGRKELDEIRRLTGVSEIGVRMHWLYYDQESPPALEKAGALYDSTIGYNETVGYRAGTTQPYKPLQASRLIELPLHVMDTALFYPDYLGLSFKDAKTVVDRMIDHAIQFGGCLTINWHDRSIFPERLWGTFYRELLGELKARGAWFSTARQSVTWFRKRRATVFETDRTESEAVRAQVTSANGEDVPRLLLRVHEVRSPRQTNASGAQQYIDIAFDNSAETYSVSEVRS
jgi:hypothetical protein